MRVFVTLAGREFAVDLEGDRAVVHSGGGVIPVTIIAPPLSSPPPESGAEVLVVPSGPENEAVTLSPLHVAFWGRAGDAAPAKALRLLVDGVPLLATLETERDRLRGRLGAAPRASGPVRVDSPLPGVIRQIFVFPGNEVTEGMALMTLEAMKMENEIRAESDGTLAVLHVEEGQVVNAGDKLCEVSAAEGSRPA